MLPKFGGKKVPSTGSTKQQSNKFISETTKIDVDDFCFVNRRSRVLIISVKEAKSIFRQQHFVLQNNMSATIYWAKIFFLFIFQEM